VEVRDWLYIVMASQEVFRVGQQSEVYMYDPPRQGAGMLNLRDGVVTEPAMNTECESNCGLGLGSFTPVVRNQLVSTVSLSPPPSVGLTTAATT
jgi:hypothetical protein